MDLLLTIASIGSFLALVLGWVVLPYSTTARESVAAAPSAGTLQPAPHAA